MHSPETSTPSSTPSSGREIIRVEKVSFSYAHDGRSTAVLKEVSLSIREGEFVAIQGPSGSGKSTFFYVLACLLRPDSGKVYIDGQELGSLSPDETAHLRNRKIGFIFQQFHLLPRATVLDNILLPTRYPCEETGSPTPELKERATKLAHSVGLGHRLTHFPNQLSGGEQQRVAIARALMNDARYLLADEPTGNLDSKNAASIMEIFKELNRQGRTIVLITHDQEVAGRCGKEYRMRDGAFIDSTAMPEASPKSSPATRKAFGGPSLARLVKVLRVVAPMAVQNLLRNRVRAVLTMFGVTVGVAALFSMITFGQYTRDKILQGYADLGVNRLLIWGWPNSKQKAKDQVDVPFRSFSWQKDIQPLARIFSQIELESPVMRGWGDLTVNYGGRSLSDDVRTMGVSAEYFEIDKREIEVGRAFTPYHIFDRNPVCLIGSEIAEKLFVETNPLGKILFITANGGGDRPAYPCEVIGVMKSLSSNIDWHKPNLEIVMPFTYFALVSNNWENEIHSFSLQLKDGSDIDSVSKGVKAFFKQKYGKSGEFGADSAALLMAQMRKFISLFTLMLGAVAMITLSVGGMGINNMMLVSIAERLKEIGLRKALGATNRSVRAQFLLESVFLCVLAGIAGILLGFTLYEVIIYVASKFVPKLTFELVIDPVALTASLFSIVVVGIASGIIPAIKAERLEVIEAMRTE